MNPYERPTVWPKPAPKPIAWGNEFREIWEDAKFGIATIVFTVAVEIIFWGLVIK